MNTDNTNSNVIPSHPFTKYFSAESYNAITEKIIGCAYKVSNQLGVGFLEKVYENALALELQKAGLKVQQQAPLAVIYVEDRILVELKVAKALDEIHQAQCMNYLRASGVRICLLINFGKPHIDIKRIVI